jgi:uncharacterized protein
MFSPQNIFVALLSLFLLMGCERTDFVTLPNGEQIPVEIADEDDEREQGLMFRKNLEENEGMLFVYDNEREMKFWMKNTLIPLDILFLDGTRTIVDIRTMAPCERDPCKLYPSALPAQYALEVNAGKASDWELEVGDQLEFSW